MLRKATNSNKNKHFVFSVYNKDSIIIIVLKLGILLINLLGTVFRLGQTDFPALFLSISSSQSRKRDFIMKLVSPNVASSFLLIIHKITLKKSYNFVYSRNIYNIENS